MVRLTERETGYSTHSSSIEERLGIESLTVSIKEVGVVLNHIANKERHLRLIDSVLDFIVVVVEGTDRFGSGNKWRKAPEESTRHLAAAIPLLRRCIHASQDYLKYLKERAERLSTVVRLLLYPSILPFIHSVRYLPPSQQVMSMVPKYVGYLSN